MDTLTHALVGTAVSDSSFRRRLGPAATPFAFIVASLPDVDSVTYLMAPESAWAHHRGYSHSFFVFLLAAPVLGYIVYRLTKKAAPWLHWTVLAFLCLATHTLGDLITSWGTMPLLPFSNARLSWDMAPILDVFLTSVTAASFVANRILRWERVDTFLNPLAYPVVHRHPRRQRAGSLVAVVALVMVVAYLGVALLQNRQTVGQARRELAAMGVEAVEVRALPIMLTSIAWNIAARGADGTIYNAVHSTLAPRPMRFAAYPTATGPAVDAALATWDGSMFAWYAQNMYVAEVEESGNGSAVRLLDRRFFSLSQPDVSRFVMEFRLDSGHRVVGANARQVAFEGMDVGREVELLWLLTRYGTLPDEAPPPGESPDIRH